MHAVQNALGYHERRLLALPPRARAVYLEYARLVFEHTAHRPLRQMPHLRHLFHAVVPFGGKDWPPWVAFVCLQEQVAVRAAGRSALTSTAQRPVTIRSPWHCSSMVRACCGSNHKFRCPSRATSWAMATAARPNSDCSCRRGSPPTRAGSSSRAGGLQHICASPRETPFPPELGRFRGIRRQGTSGPASSFQHECSF